MYTEGFKLSKSEVRPNSLRISKGFICTDEFDSEFSPSDPLELTYIPLDKAPGRNTFDLRQRWLDKGSGSLCKVPEDMWTVQTVSLNYPICSYYVNYGSKLYSSSQDARDHLWDSEYLVQCEGLILCGWVVSRGPKNYLSSDIIPISLVEVPMDTLKRPKSESFSLEKLRGVILHNKKFLGSCASGYYEMPKEQAELEFFQLLRVFFPSNYIDFFDANVRVVMTPNFAGGSYFRILMGGQSLFE